MHSPCSDNYLSLISESPAPLSEDAHRKLVEMLQEIFDTRHNVGMFCWIVALATRCISTRDDDVRDVVSSCAFIYECIQHHCSVTEISSDSALSGWIVQAMTGKLYAPTAVDILDGLNRAYCLMDTACLETAHALLCVAHGNSAILSLSVKTMAASAYYLAQTLEGNTNTKALPHRADCAQQDVDVLYRCVTESCLFDYLPDRLQVACCEYIPVTTPEHIQYRAASHALPSSPAVARILRQKGVVIGAGEFSSVVRVKTSSNTQIALKRQNSEMIFVKEVCITASLCHANVQSVERITCNDLSFCMPVMCHNLRDEIARRMLTPVTYRRYIRELFTGLAYLQDCAVMHGDIKPENLLITASGELKISDFGQSIGWMVAPKLLPTRYVTPLYRALELYVGGEECLYGMEVDVWSCGIIILEMTHGERFTEALEVDVLRGIKEMLDDRLEGVTEEMDRDVAQIVRQCLSIPLCRATPRQCLAVLFE